MNVSGRMRALLIVGGLAFAGAFMALAYWQGWTWLTDGPRPFGLVVAGALYWGPTGLILALHDDTPAPKGGAGTIQVDRPQRAVQDPTEAGPPQERQGTPES